MAIEVASIIDDKKGRRRNHASNLLLPDFFGGAVFAELSADRVSGLSLIFRVTTYSVS